MEDRGTLYVVATPIGHLEDITRRAVRILGEVAAVAAEDTRRTGNLLRHLGIRKPLVSLHAHNEHARTRRVLDRLAAGESVALTTDAGTPGISDPGAVVVRAAREAGFVVEAIPGPSVVTAFLSASGMDASRFVFAGFPPVRSKDRKLWFAWVESCASVPVIVLEAPHRVRRTLQECGTYLVNRPISLARELTKAHETWYSGSPEVILDRLGEPRGEFVFAIHPREAVPSTVADVQDSDIRQLFGRITDLGEASRRDAIRRTARELGIPTRAVFQALERTK